MLQPQQIQNSLGECITIVSKNRRFLTLGFMQTFAVTFAVNMLHNRWLLVGVFLTESNILKFG